MNAKRSRTRIATKLLEEGATGTPSWWYLSFCDPNRPTGTQFLGACLVEARGIAEAITQAHLRGCNPGGEVQGVALPPGVGPADFPNPVNTLLSKEDLGDTVSFDEAFS